MTTRGEINSNFYQIVNVDANGAPTEVKPQYLPNIGDANYANFAGQVVDSTQSNITAVGTLTGLAVSGLTDLGNVGNITITGGSAGYVLSTDGLGNLDWAIGGGGGNGTPGGVNTYVQFNDAGTFGGNVNFIYDKTTDILTVGNISANGSLLTNINGANVSEVANANYANFAGDVVNASQSNITSLGTLVSLTVSGNITSGNADLGNLVVANFFSGDGGLLSNITAATSTNSNYANFAGNVVNAIQSNITSVGNLVNLTVVGNASANSIQLNTNTGVTVANIGAMFWDEASNTVTLGMNNGVQQQIGLESYVLVKASATITDGQVVMFTGANGNHVTAAPADTTSVGFRPEYIIGVATQNIATNDFGYITVFGIVHGLNTNSFNVGDILWVDNATPGGLTATRPSDPNFQIEVAAVTKKSGGDGHLQVRVTAFNDINSLTDVVTTTPSAGQALIYTSSNTWVNGNPNIANSATTAGTVTTNAQPNITSTGTLANLTVTGNITSGNANLGNLVTANFFSGNGSALTGLSAAGSNRFVQFNNNGVLGADANLQFYTGNGVLNGVAIELGNYVQAYNTVIRKFNETVVAGGNTGATTISPDLATGSIYTYTLTGNITLNTLTNATSGSSATIVLTQDATGNRLLTSNMKFAGASKTLSTAANTTDIISVFYNGTTYYATLSKGYA